MRLLLFYIYRWDNYVDKFVTVLVIDVDFSVGVAYLSSVIDICRLKLKYLRHLILLMLLVWLLGLILETGHVINRN